MSSDRIDRRDFLRSTTLGVAATMATALRGAQNAEARAADASKVDPRKIRNYNPNMGYRRLGKTNLIISEVGLGGHWRAPWRRRSDGWWWGKFANEEVPEEVARNRTEVVSKAIDCGMNYLDITGGEECLCYGAALKGRRERMFVGADDYRLCPRHDEYCNTKAQVRNVEACLRRIGTDYLDLWRVQAKMDGTNTDADVEATVAAFHILHKAGKVRHFGMSSHSRPWAQHIIEKYPEVEMFIFPCTAKTRQKDAPPTRDNIEEVATGYGPENRSVFQSLKDHDVGLVTIKPFFGGSLFQSHGKVKLGVGSKEDNDLARLTIECVLNLTDAITSVIPGLSTIYEVENAARASYPSRRAMAEADRRWLEQRTDERWARLPAQYTWLRDWQTI